MRALTNRHSLAKLFMAWIVGLTVLVGPSAVSLAAPKDDPNKSCRCTCAGDQAGGWNKDLVSQDERHCKLNGRKCTATIGGTKLQGTLHSCSICTKGGICVAVGAAGAPLAGGGARAPIGPIAPPEPGAPPAGGGAGAPIGPAAPRP
jgi:hypothetical protein